MYLFREFETNRVFSLQQLKAYEQVVYLFSSCINMSGEKDCWTAQFLCKTEMVEDQCKNEPDWTGSYILVSQEFGDFGFFFK